jgi:dipeptidyl aminopeptidase/acylaminoacyl peptidase
VTHPDYQALLFFDPALERDLAPLRTAQPSGLRLASMDDAERRLVVEIYTDKGRSYLLLDRATGTMSVIGQSPLLAHAPSLAPMRPVAFPSRDGLTLHGYLTVTPGVPPRAPMVLLVHGGPWVRDYWGFDSTVQFLANRGYAVLQVNYRGSSGYGRAFLEASVRQHAGRMHDDLIDAVRWAVAEGVADPERVAIAGASYGGYATLVGMTFTPETFACGIDTVGMSNLVTMLEAVPPYWRPFMAFMHKHYGDPGNPEDRQRLEAQSPLFRADKLARPLLVIHGANDVRVKQRESDQMVAALRAAGKPVQYLVIEDEGHLRSYGNWRNTLRRTRAMEEFLAGCLGGRRSGRDLFEPGPDAR